MTDYGDYRDELIGTPKGMGMYLIHFELSNVGEVIEESAVGEWMRKNGEFKYLY